MLLFLLLFHYISYIQPDILTQNNSNFIYYTGIYLCTTKDTNAFYTHSLGPIIMDTCAFQRLAFRKRYHGVIFSRRRLRWRRRWIRFICQQSLKRFVLNFTNSSPYRQVGCYFSTLQRVRAYSEYKSIDTTDLYIYIYTLINI